MSDDHKMVTATGRCASRFSIREPVCIALNFITLQCPLHWGSTENRSSTTPFYVHEMDSCWVSINTTNNIIQLSIHWLSTGPIAQRNQNDFHH